MIASRKFHLPRSSQGMLHCTKSRIFSEHRAWIERANSSLRHQVWSDCKLQSEMLLTPLSSQVCPDHSRILHLWQPRQLLAAKVWGTQPSRTGRKTGKRSRRRRLRTEWRPIWYLACAFRYGAHSACWELSLRGTWRLILWDHQRCQWLDQSLLL